jgi:hypothetical protein
MKIITYFPNPTKHMPNSRTMDEAQNSDDSCENMLSGDVPKRVLIHSATVVTFERLRDTQKIHLEIGLKTGQPGIPNLFSP